MNPIPKVMDAIGAHRKEQFVMRLPRTGKPRTERGTAVILAVGFLGDSPEEIEEADLGEFDAFAGGYPVPPMPGQVLPELTGVVASTAEGDQSVVGEEK